METVRAAVEERTLEPQRTTTTTSTQQRQRQQHRSLIIFYLCVKAVETAQREPQEEEEVEKEENLKGQPTTIVASAQEVKLEEESVGNNKCTRNVFTARISLPDINHSSLLVHS